MRARRVVFYLAAMVIGESLVLALGLGLSRQLGLNLRFILLVEFLVLLFAGASSGLADFYLLRRGYANPYILKEVARRKTDNLAVELLLLTLAAMTFVTILLLGSQ